MLLTGAVAGGTLALCGFLRWYLNRPDRRATDCGREWVCFAPLWNRGGAFGLPLKAPWLAGLSALLLAMLPVWGRDCPLGSGLVLGGGASNLWERVRYGKVYDYLRFPKAPGPARRYVYNGADLAIFLGAFLMLCRTCFPKRR